MRNLLILATFLPIAAFAQWQPPSSTTDPFDGEETESYFNFASNFSLVARNNYSLGMNNYEHYVDYSWHGWDEEEEEPIDEIIVVGQRRVNHGWELYMHLQFNFAGNQICTNYTDGGHCTATEMYYDPELIPIEGGCQTVEGFLGPLTGAQANVLNVDHLNERAAGAALVTLSTTAAGAGLGGTPGALIGGLGGIVTTISGFTGELPFTAGDQVEWTLTVCNDGDGGVDQTMDVTIS